MDGYIEGINRFISQARIQITLHDPEALRRLVSEIPESETLDDIVPVMPEPSIEPENVTSLQNDWEMVDDDFFKPTVDSNLQDEINASFGINNDDLNDNEKNNTNLQQHSLFSQSVHQTAVAPQPTARRRFGFLF